MATLSTLIEQDVIRRWEVPLPATQQPDRMLLLLPSLVPSLEAAVATPSTWNIEESVGQQLDALTLAFVSGDALVYEWQVKNLVHHQDGVWYLKSADTRLFGWFPKRDCFIAAPIEIAEQVKQHNLYAGFAGQVVRYRDRTPLDEPKYIAGDDPHAVVSNLTFPS